MTPGSDVVVGVVGKPLGLKGEVYVRPQPDVSHEVAVGDTLLTGDGRTLVVESVRDHSGRTVMRFAGVVDREGAESLRGAVLSVSRGEVMLDEETFWSDDLLGREVVDDAGTVVGLVEATLDGAAHDYLVVARPDGGEVLVPAVAELVSVEDERIVVHAIPGLLDEA